ncbi:MAG: DUF3237 domain-containing protein [Candidatus Tumulicola sp.]
MDAGLPQLEPIFDIRLEFDQRLRIGPVPGGGHVGFTAIAGGEVCGPRLTGRAIPHSGGDWARIRDDGVIVFNAHYLLEASDGTLIYLRNTGYGRTGMRPLGPGESYEEAERTQHYFRVTPQFDVPVGPHDWLTRTVVIGYGERHENPDHTIFRYFAVP